MQQAAIDLDYEPPLGSGSAGNMSLPHIDQADTAVTMPANPVSSIFVHICDEVEHTEKKVLHSVS